MNDLFKGYRLDAGHGSSLLYFIVTLIIYALGFAFLKPSLAPAYVEPPALAWLLMIVILLAWVLPGIAFFLDRYRIPVVVVLAIYALVIWWAGESDYYYPLETKQEAAVSGVDNLSSSLQAGAGSKLRSGQPACCRRCTPGWVKNLPIILSS
jgi:hypothetical protein